MYQEPTRRLSDLSQRCHVRKFACLLARPLSTPVDGDQGKGAGLTDRVSPHRPGPRPALLLRSPPPPPFPLAPRRPRGRSEPPQAFSRASRPPCRPEHLHHLPLPAFGASRNHDAIGSTLTHAVGSPSNSSLFSLAR